MIVFAVTPNQYMVKHATSFLHFTRQVIILNHWEPPNDGVGPANQAGSTDKTYVAANRHQPSAAALVPALETILMRI